jgi:signal transduction histidine kinase
VTAIRAATRPGEPSARLGLVVMLVAWAAVLTRVLILTSDSGLRLAYVAGMVVFLVMLVVVIVRRPRPTPMLHIVFAAQVAIVLVLLALDTDRDFVTTLLVLECYQAAVAFAGSTRLVWVAFLVTTIGCSLVLALGPLHGLALALIPMAAGIVLAMFPVVGGELEAARAHSAAMVAHLRAAQGQLQVYAGQVDELAAIEERSRLARELQASVSGTLASALEASAATRASLADPDGAASQLERLQALTQEALAQMRRIIGELRPPVPTDVPSTADRAGPE